MQKNATQTKAQQATLRSKGLDPAEWVVLRDYPNSLIIRNRFSNEHRVITKS